MAHTGLLGSVLQTRTPICACSARRTIKPVAYKTDAEQEVSSRAAPSSFKNQLEALKSMTVVVADSGELHEVQKYQPQDCTTNPSLVYKAVQVPEYKHLLGEAVKLAKQDKNVNDLNRPFAGVADVLAVNIGAEMLKSVPGRVSTEVDAHLSHNTKKTVDKALRIMDLYAQKGVDPERVYIKIGSTWEGIEACRQLQKQGVDCNMTLIFSAAQAIGCADAGAALVSPFVGRIMDWYKAKEGRTFAPHEDPGVLSVRKIYKYYKSHNYKTIVMAASFRNVGEIRELAGCDNITISPALLRELEASTDPLPRKLSPSMADPDSIWIPMNKAVFETMHGADQMAVEKLEEGIKSFAGDQMKLEDLLAAAANER